MVDLGIIVVSFNTKELTRECLKSIYQEDHGVSYQVAVIDNNSTDGSAEMVAKDFSRASLIRNKENVGFSRANNQGIKKINARFYLLLNSDTVVLPGSIRALVDFAKRNKFGIISPKILNTDKTFQSNAGDLPTFFPVFNWLSGIDDLGTVFGRRLPSFHLQHPKFYYSKMEVGWVAGTAMLISQETVERVSLLDEKIFMYAEDVDYCWRAHDEGIKVGWMDEALIVHHGGASTNTPRFTQWRGEFRGLIYLYKKRYNDWQAFLLKFGAYIFILFRIIVFSAALKFGHVKTYAKVFKSL